MTVDVKEKCEKSRSGCGIIRRPRQIFHCTIRVAAAPRLPGFRQWFCSMSRGGSIVTRRRRYTMRGTRNIGAEHPHPVAILRNPITIAGVLLTTISAVLFLGFLLLDLFGFGAHA